VSDSIVIISNVCVCVFLCKCVCVCLMSLQLCVCVYIVFSVQAVIIISIIELFINSEGRNWHTHTHTHTHLLHGGVMTNSHNCPILFSFSLSLVLSLSLSPPPHTAQSFCSSASDLSRGWKRKKLSSPFSHPLPPPLPLLPPFSLSLSRLSSSYTRATRLSFHFLAHIPSVLVSQSSLFLSSSLTPTFSWRKEGWKEGRRVGRDNERRQRGEIRKGRVHRKEGRKE